MENNQLEQERREERRKRRRRNQIGAYIILILLILGAATGIVFGIKYIAQLGFGKSNEANKESSVEDFSDEDYLEPTESLEPSLPDDNGPELSYEEKLDEIVNAGIEVMPLEDKVAGLFMVAPEAITGVGTAIQAGEGTRDALAEYAVGGIVYFTKNMQTKEQLMEMISNTKMYTKYPLFIGVDEEGGSVNRVAASGIAEKVDSAKEIGLTLDADNAYLAGAEIGGYLSELGFTLDFAPVADLANVDNSIMDGRAYGSEAATVSSFVTSMMRGLEEQNITACLKHFPGIGSTTADTHNGLSVSGRSAEEFRSEEFAVFQMGIDAGAQMIMVGHMAAPALTGSEEIPCSVSREVVTDILRNELQFDGVIITDAMNMGAITEQYESGEAAVLALQAGCDMILMPEEFDKAYQGVLSAVRNGVISEERIDESLRRIYRIKYADL